VHRGEDSGAGRAGAPGRVAPANAAGPRPGSGSRAP
jgi:hypothetical protein